jgi:hypothetical protein
MVSQRTKYLAYSSDKTGQAWQRGAPLLLAVTAVLLIILPSMDANANCEDLLDSDIYRCRVKADDGTGFTECFRFESPGTQSEDFDLFPDQLGAALACDCKAKGTFARPDFGAANSFHCVSGSAVGLGVAFEGAVRRGGRTIRGQAVTETGVSFVFRCSRASSCEVPLSTLGAPAATWYDD